MSDFYLCRIKSLNFQGPIFLCPVKKKKCGYGFNRVRIKDSGQSFFSILEQCPVQCQASLACVPWYPWAIWENERETRPQRPRALRATKVQTALFGELCIPQILRTSSGHDHSGQRSLFPGMTDKHFLHHPNFTTHASVSPWFGPLPPVFCR